MQPLINLSHLKFFCDAVIYNSISEAAKLNYVSQSAVSQGITKLERILGVQLIVHTRQKFQVTEEGKVVFEQARNIFKTVEETYIKLNQNKESVEGPVKVASSKSLGMAFASHMYKKMKQNFPQVDVNFKLGGLNFIRNSLRQKEAEFAIVVHDQDFVQFNKHPLRKGRFNLYHNITAGRYLKENGVLVDFLEGTHVRPLREYFSEVKSQLKIQMELSGWSMVAHFTDMGLGIGFIPDYITSNERYPNLKIFPSEIPHFEYEICAIYNRGEKLSRAACAFIDQFSLDSDAY